MNERIEQLAEQCWVHTNEPLFGAKSPHWEFDRHKFAELIVRECIAIVEPSSYRRAYPENYRGGIDCLDTLDDRVEKIKEHFGVRE